MALIFTGRQTTGGGFEILLEAFDGEKRVMVGTTSDELANYGLEVIQKRISEQYDAGEPPARQLHITDDLHVMRDWSPAEFMMYSATRIVSMNAGVSISSGTGFFYHSHDTQDDQEFLLLVTNKHVLEGADEIQFTLNDGADAPTNGVMDFHHPIRPELITSHPTADLCASNITSAFEAALGQGWVPYFASVRAKDIPSDEEWKGLDAIESVTMIGCPNGLYDRINALPIARSGNTSSHPSKNYNGENEFLVDIACFPGSSGSPIYRYDRGGGRWDKTARRHIADGNVRLMLLGILYSGPTITEEGLVEFVKEPKVEIQSMMHLGIAIRSSELLVLERIFHEEVRQSKRRVAKVPPA